MWLPERLGISPALPRSIQLAAIFYLAHIVAQGWIGASEGFLALAVIAAGVAIARRQLEIPFHPVYLPLGTFLAGSTLSAALAPDPLFSLRELGEWLAFLTFPLALALYRRVPRFATLAMRAFFLLAILLATWGIFEYFVLGHRTLEQRITGPAAHVMTYSGLLLPLTLFFLVIWLHDRKWHQMLAAAATGLALLLTFTRGAWAGWLVAFLTLVATRFRRAVVWIATVLILAVTFSPFPLFERFVSSFDLTRASNLDRLRMLEAGVEIIRDYPLFGVGPPMIEEFYPLYRKADAPRFRIPHLHNSPVQIWAERGVVAFAAYILILAVFLFVFARLRRDPFARNRADAGLAILIALSVNGLFEFNFGDTEVLLNMLDLFALLVFLTEEGAAGSEQARIESPSPLFSVA